MGKLKTINIINPWGYRVTREPWTSNSELEFETDKLRVRIKFDDLYYLKDLVEKIEEGIVRSLESELKSWRKLLPMLTD